MRSKLTIRLITLLFFLLPFLSMAGGEKGTETDIKSEIKAYIQHHLEDTYDFGLWSYTTDEGVHEDNGLQVFSSSKFHHGESVAQAGDAYYKLDHRKIYKTDAEGTINYDETHHATNVKPLDFSITKNVFTIMIVSLLLFFIFSRMAKTYKTNSIPSGIGRILEPIVLYVRDDIAIPNIGKKHYKRYMSYLLTVFFFVWTINLLGLTPLGINVTNNIAVTFCLAMLTYLITTFTAKKDYWMHIFLMPGVPKLMRLVLAPIELLGTFIKPFSLMIRLYANITAGHIVLMSLIGLMFIFKSWLGSSLSFVLAFGLGILELLVAALQAYIFTMLSALYFGSAVEEHDHDHAH